MAITEPGVGSDSANIQTTATLDGDDYVINGEKIYVTAGERCDHVVVWATLDKKPGRAAIKSFVVPKGTPGMTLERLEHKLGIRSSDTATFRFENCRVPKENLLGSPDVDAKQGFAGAMATFDNTRPLVAAMAVGCARASLELTKELLEEVGVVVDYDRPADHPVRRGRDAASRWSRDWEAAYLLTLQAAWMADNGKPNSLEASMAKAKAGRGRQRHHAAVRRARREHRLQRARPAGEVGAGLQDPGHLRGHAADPAARSSPGGCSASRARAEVGLSRLRRYRTSPLGRMLRSNRSSWARRWWKPQSGRPLSRSVRPPCDQACGWWTSHQAKGRSQPSAAQVSWVTDSARRWRG